MKVEGLPTVDWVQSTVKTEIEQLNAKLSDLVSQETKPGQDFVANVQQTVETLEKSIKTLQASSKSFEAKETQKSEATFSEVLKLKHAVTDMAKEHEGKVKAIETLINRMVTEFNKKHASFEDEFTSNFEMIKNIVLHTDKETTIKIKEQEKRFTESHQGLVDMVKQKHVQFDLLLDKLIQGNNTE